MPRGENQHSLHTALSFHQAGQLNQAAAIYRKILRNEPNNYQALHYLGVIEASGGNFEQAKSLIARSLQHQPGNMQFLENYAGILFQAGEYEVALQVCEQGLRSNPRIVPLLYIGAIVLYKLKRFEKSVEQFDRVLALAPNHIVAINERGSVLAELKRFDDALANFQKALALQPRYPEAHLNIGNLYGVLRRYDDALAAYRSALALNGGLADAWLGCGNIDVKLGAYEHALAAFDKALALKPDSAGAWLGRGNALSQLRRHDEAFAAYDKALTLRPDGPFAEGARLDAKLQLCSWSHLAEEAAHLESSIAAGIPTSPFVTLALTSSPRTQLEAARSYSRTEYPAAEPLWRGEKYQHDRIRIAYLSGDYGEHPVSYLLVGLLERHDRDRFETIGLSFRPIGSSAMAGRVRDSFGRFIDVAGRSDREAAELIKSVEVDIAVDLMGYTAHSRTPILAQRAAPVQVNYLGYPGTMGADYIDYIIADPTVLPAEHAGFYSEAVAWLPDAYLSTDATRPIAPTTPNRRELGLPEDAFVFCCFNLSYKINPDMFDVWMRLLRQVDNSVLWLRDYNAVTSQNLRTEAQRRGIAPERLIFAPRLPLAADHLARQPQADLFLDTLPYNAHTTGTEALWVGLPVLTCLGSSFAGRVGASINNAIGMPELVTNSLSEYEALALKIARDPALCAALKEKLARNRDAYPLFDTARFTRHVETAYQRMWQTHRDGRPPASFALESDA